MKFKLNKKSILIICITILIILLNITISLKSFSKYRIVGKWTTDEITVYKFNSNNTGILILPLSKYEFTYSIKNHRLKIDFKDEKSMDTEYVYKFKNNKLILTGENGTFIMKKEK